MFDRRTFRNTSGRPKFLALPSMSPRRISVPVRTERFTPAERAFLRAIPPYVRSLEKYKAFYPVYVHAAVAVYNKYNVPANLRFNWISRVRNGQLERHVVTKQMYSHNTPEKRRFMWVTKHLDKLESDVRASEQVYRVSSRVLREQYGLSPHAFRSSNRNFNLENRIKYKSARVIENQISTHLKTKGLSTFARGMNARNFPQNLTEKIIRTSLNRLA
jgi:hypothetical protein